MAKKPIEHVEIEIDGQPVTVPQGRPVLWSARALGFDIPHFCAHQWLEPYGACRMCLAKVEVGGRMMPKLQTTCSLLPAPGMKIWTKDPEVIAARKEQLEFHLLNHPLECPICDKGGECMLQDQTMDHGVQQGRYIEQKKVRPDAMMNAYIRLNYKRCIHCKRCVNYCTDIDGSYFLQFVERGAETFISSFADPAEAPRFTGNVIDMCPVGALTARNYRFTMGRPWEQELTASVGSLDSVGSNIWLCARLGDVVRIVPRDNPDVENGLIDDVTRFSWECIEDDRRLREGILREAEGERQVSRASAEEEAVQRLVGVIGEHGPGCVGVIAGGGLNTEEYLALKSFCGWALNTVHYHFGDELFGMQGPDNSLLAACLGHCEELSDILAASTVLTLGCDLFEEAPSLGLRLDIAARRGQLKLLAARSHGSDLDRFSASYVDYGYGNLLRVVRGLTNSLIGAGEVPAELAELAGALKDVGEDCAILFGEEVWRSEDPPALLNALAALRQAIAQANPAAQGVYLNPVYPSVNSAGALLVNYLDRFTGKELERISPAVGSLGQVLQAAIDGKLRALLIVEADLLTTYPDRQLVERALSAVDSTIYVGPFGCPTAEQADIVLPLGTWAHREGTVCSMEWRLQQRRRASVDSVAPSVLDVLNSLAVGMGLAHIASGGEELWEELARLAPAVAAASPEELPDTGVLLKIPLENSAGPSTEGVLPQEIGAGGSGSLVVVPKRFLYNDRPEVRFSPVFDAVNKPFQAYLNPADMSALGLAEGDEVSLRGENGGELLLKAGAGGWVRPGSVVINDYCLQQPANRLAGRRPVTVTVKKLSGVREA